MRHVLELCVRIDELAERSYREMADHCTDRRLAPMFRQMADEERAHADWWRRLLRAWDDGLVPDAFNDSVDLEVHVESLSGRLNRLMSADISKMDCDTMLDRAVRMEFFMLDPVFGELLDLAEPARAQARREAYAQHIERLVSGVQDSYGADSLTGFLAGLMRRTWRDNVELATHAIHDVLTGLHNRRSLDAHLRQWASWSQRYGRPLAVVLVDVDDFRRVNDDFGHMTGDRALKAIGATIVREVRGSDLVARYGGDEFAIVAPELAPDEFEALCLRIVRSVRDLSLADESGRPIPLTVSVGGVVAAPRPDGEPPTPEELLAAADRGLYAAKRGGKDRAASPFVLDMAAAAV